MPDNHKDLSLLLEAHFSTDELFRMVSLSTVIPNSILNGIATPISRENLVRELVEVLQRRQLLGQTFFEELVAQRPALHAEVSRIALLYGIATLATIDQVGVGVPEGTNRTFERPRRTTLFLALIPGISAVTLLVHLLWGTSEHNPHTVIQAVKSHPLSIPESTEIELVSVALAQSKTVVSEDPPRPFLGLSRACSEPKTSSGIDATISDISPISSTCEHPERYYRTVSLTSYYTNPGAYDTSRQGSYPVLRLALRHNGLMPTAETGVGYRTLAIAKANSGNIGRFSSNTLIRHSIEHWVGDQVVTLESPIEISPGANAEVELELRPNSCRGCAWLMEIGLIFDGAHAVVWTEPMAIWMTSAEPL